ncbi:HPr kinase/phosphorylase [Labrenzia sp. PHM005]|uniref:HPr kinase/phosphorylase n=1 Tax=Labrenzia sp. PHM005 TaxID=2590016 RepID=UPI001140858D|nr:HPr kinase/phosphatase C-terminal domain-containing protein [Labrenzia sp. PHM005]QDG74657.1 aldolase [Labrenzia sp. PHM005]
MSRSTIHANCLVVGTKGILIRGASGSGKSSLSETLIESAQVRGQFAALVSDDRVQLRVETGRLIAEPPSTLQGLMETRGFGIVQVRHLPKAQVHLIVDLIDLEEMERIPELAVANVMLEGAQLSGIKCPAVAPQSALRLIRWAFKHLFPGSPDYF